MRFPGQYYDAESGLNYNYFRDYDPATGRYVESDPIGLNGGLNTYSYAYSSPTSIIDPDGQFSFAISPAVAAINAIGGAIATHKAHEAVSDKHERDQADSPEKKSERNAYHRRCDETPPSGLSKCELIRWKISGAKDCIRMRQDYIYKWRDTYPARPVQIAQRQRELACLESQEKCCGS